MGPADGSADGKAEGRAVVGRSVGTLLGRRVDGAPVLADVGGTVGNADGRAVVGEGVEPAMGMAVAVVGAAVGAYVTSCTPAPATTAVPVQAVAPVQPSSIRYVCAGVPAGTVYCTCAHTLPPVMHCAGGRLPVPVSSYTTSTPVDE